MLADAAHVAGGKLYVLGGGWSIMGPGPARMTLVVKLDVPATEAETRHSWRVSLVDADGHIVTRPDGAAYAVAGDLVIRGATGLPAGVPVDAPLAIDLGAVQVPPGRYEWRVWVDDHTGDDWFVAFTCRAPQQQPA